eukprot:659748-Pleurochrysis_carterae.AAC.3
MELVPKAPLRTTGQGQSLLFGFTHAPARTHGRPPAGRLGRCGAERRAKEGEKRGEWAWCHVG